MKRPVKLDDMESHERKYFKYCTPYAYNHIKEQLQLAPKIRAFSKDASGRFFLGHNLSVSVDDCQCAFFTSMKLPCRHIFALRKELKYGLFIESLCDERWTKHYYCSCHRIFKANTSPNNHLPDDSECVPVKVKRQANILSQHEKYRKVFGITQRLASAASETTGKLFNSRLELLQDILTAWQQGKEVTCSINTVKDECSNLTSADKVSSNFVTNTEDDIEEDEPVNLSTGEQDTICSEEKIPTCGNKAKLIRTLN